MTTFVFNRKLKPLPERARNRAYEAARIRIAGPIIDPKKFVSSTPSKYSTWTILLVVLPLLVLLVAAFLPSAYRIHTAGMEEFCRAAGRDTTNQSFDTLSLSGADQATALKALADADWRCSIVGDATVLLAEVGQVVFFFALAVLGDNIIARRMYWMGVILSTLISLVGNGHISRPWDHGNYLFAWLETFVPPVLVMSIGYTLKELLLYYVSKRRSFIIEVASAEAKRNRLLEEPETGEREWLRLYSLAIKAEYMREYSSQDRVLQTISGDEWQFMIKEEMLASNFTVDPTQLTRLEQLDIDRRRREEAERQEQARKTAEEREEQRARAAEASHEAERIEFVAEKVKPIITSVVVSRNGRHEKANGAHIDLASVQMPPNGDEVWMTNSEQSLWGARDGKDGDVVGVEFKTSKAAEIALRRFRIQARAKK